MVKNLRNPEKTKQALLRAAGELLAARGLSGFHVHDIAARAGYGKPLVYRYFGDRRAVLDALAQIKVNEVMKVLAEAAPPKQSSMPASVYHQVIYARHLAGDPVLQGLMRAQLTGELGVVAAKALDQLIPASGMEGEAGAAEAFLLAGISYVLLLRNSQKTCAGFPIQTANDLARFERAFVKLCSQLQG